VTPRWLTGAELRTARAMRRILRRRFPLCFRPRGKSKWPLARDVALQLMARCPDLPGPEVALALADYTRGMTYFRCLAAGAGRRNLDGALEGIVTDAEARAAALTLDRMIAHNHRQTTAAQRAKIAAAMRVPEPPRKQRAMQP